MCQIYWSPIKRLVPDGVCDPFFNFNYEGGTVYNFAPRNGRQRDGCSQVVLHLASLPISR